MGHQLGKEYHPAVFVAEVGETRNGREEKTAMIRREELCVTSYQAQGL